MQQKDHYSTLKIKPNATRYEIKKAYYKLAMLYHPDKNEGNAFAEAAFKEINEAYTLLSDAAKRKQYNQSFFQNKQYNDAVVAAVTPQDVLLQAQNLYVFLSKANTFKLNIDGLYFQLQEIVSTDNIFSLKEKGDVISIKKFLEIVMNCCKYLPAGFSNKITQTLLQLALQDSETTEYIRHFQKSQNKLSLWEKNKFLLAFIVALLVCMLIWFIFK
jgi:curved DNA-binding protein CbpA